MRRFARDLQGFLVLLVALALGAVLLLNNARPQVSYTAPGTNQQAPTSSEGSVQDMMAAASNLTSIPPTNTLDALLPPTSTPTPVFVQDGVAFSATSAAPTPTRYVPGQPTEIIPTAAATPEGPDVRRDPNPRAGQFSPPPEIAPLSLDPKDHFYFRRPVDSSANSTELFYYVYGSDGPQNEWRVHHGIDLGNPIGKEVYAAGDGRVIYAGSNYTWKRPNGQIDRAYTYGNVVIIEHDFGWQGKRLYTLYAHLKVILPNIVPNTHVKMGDVIALSGDTGEVSGPHVHFEVRVDENWYYSTRNPILWMTPYEGYGVVAGRLLYANGRPVEDQIVYLTQGRTTIDTTTTYVHPKQPDSTTWNVVSDEVWKETFAIGDVPAGDYTIFMNVNGIRFEKQITVRPGTTTFVDFGQVPLPGVSISTPATAVPSG